jgi:hypothetical protein
MITQTIMHSRRLSDLGEGLIAEWRHCQAGCVGGVSAFLAAGYSRENAHKGAPRLVHV